MPRITARLLLIAAFLYFAALIGGLYVNLHAQEPGCYQIDRFGVLCIPGTGEIFVDHALTLKSSAQQENLVLAQYAPGPDDARYLWIHANYPRCCNHLDCKPATVKWTPRGWEVLGADHLVAEKDAIPWPFGEPFACMVGGRVRCLFLNSGG